MTWSALSSLLQVGALASLAVAAVIDVRSRTIPNGLVVCVLVAGLVLRLLSGAVGALISVAVALAMLIALGGLARRNHIGGGDAKMIAAATLLVAPSQVLALITAIVLTGGVLAVLYSVGRLVLRFAKRRRAALSLNLDAPTHAPADPASARAVGEIASDDQLPYGVAIFAGTAIVLWGWP